LVAPVRSIVVGTLTVRLVTGAANGRVLAGVAVGVGAGVAASETAGMIRIPTAASVTRHEPDAQEMRGRPRCCDAMSVETTRRGNATTAMRSRGNPGRASASDGSSRSGRESA
jgi:hypothetical protein